MAATETRGASLITPPSTPKNGSPKLSANVPHTFFWPYPAGKAELAGSFDVGNGPWKPIPMNRREDAEGFELTLPLLEGHKYIYKFVVDGNWTCDESATKVWDGSGNSNHEVTIERPVEAPSIDLAVEELSVEEAVDTDVAEDSLQNEDEQPAEDEILVEESTETTDSVDVVENHEEEAVEETAAYERTVVPADELEILLQAREPIEHHELDAIDEQPEEESQPLEAELVTAVEEPALATKEDALVEDAIVEDTIVEDTIVENTAVEDAIVEDTIVENTAVEDTVVEEPALATKEDAIVETTIVEDTIVENTAVEDTIVEDAVEDTIVENAAVEDTKVESTIAEDTDIVAVEEVLPEAAVEESPATEEKIVVAIEEPATEELTESDAVETAMTEIPLFDAAAEKTTEAEEISSPEGATEAPVAEVIPLFDEDVLPAPYELPPFEEAPVAPLPDTVVEAAIEENPSTPSLEEVVSSEEAAPVVETAVEENPSFEEVAAVETLVIKEDQSSEDSTFVAKFPLKSTLSKAFFSGEAPSSTDAVAVEETPSSEDITVVEAATKETPFEEDTAVVVETPVAEKPSFLLSKSFFAGEAPSSADAVVIEETPSTEDTTVAETATKETLFEDTAVVVGTAVAEEFPLSRSFFAKSPPQSTSLPVETLQEEDEDEIDMELTEFTPDTSFTLTEAENLPTSPFFVEKADVDAKESIVIHSVYSDPVVVDVVAEKVVVSEPIVETFAVQETVIQPEVKITKAIKKESKPSKPYVAVKTAAPPPSAQIIAELDPWKVTTTLTEIIWINILAFIATLLHELGILRKH